MRYKQNDKLGLSISEICVGTWAMGGLRYGAVDHNDSIEAIRAMLNQGVNIIDTAPAYGYGRSEMLVAEAISDYKREDIFIVTKCGITPSATGAPPMKDGRYKPIVRDCETSLGLLKCGYIDFYLIHHPDPDCPFEETMSALNDLKKQGKIRFIGLSNFNKEQIIETQKFAEIDAIQVGFNMVDQGKGELMRWAADQGMVVMTYGSLGAGILTGAIRSMPEFAENDFRLTMYDYFKEPKFSRIQKLLETLDTIAQAHNAPVAQVTLNWSTQNPFVTTALTGVRNKAEALENIAGLSWSLGKEEITEINSALVQLGLGEST